MVLGEEMMKRRIITWTIVLFGLTGIAQAVRPVGEDPFVNITVTPSIFDLGTIPFVGTQDSSEVLRVKVDANCMHGPITLSATAFEGPRGGSISPKHIYVKSSATDGFETMEKPVSISKPEEGPHDILLKFRLHNMYDRIEPAGRYKGTFTFTIIPALF